MFAMIMCLVCSFEFAVHGVLDVSSHSYDMLESRESFQVNQHGSRWQSVSAERKLIPVVQDLS